MLDKISLRRIWADHIDTFRDFGTKEYKKSDFLLFFGVPVVPATLIVVFVGTTSGATITVLITSLSVFAALLLNLLLVIYSVANRRLGAAERDQDAVSRQVLREVFSNISFATATAVVGVVVLVGLAIDSNVWGVEIVLSAVIHYLLGVFVLTVLMILKRMHILLAKELRERSANNGR